MTLIALLAIAVGSYSYYHMRQVTDPSYQQIAVAQERERTIHAVSRIMILPDGIPEVVTVPGDIETLKKKQPFFTKALPGDRVLIYEKDAILYRPSTRQIVNVWPVNRPENPEANSAQEATPSIKK